jgi:putative endonuclease
LNHLEFGAAGERVAARYIERLGWRIVGRNIRCGGGELDIVAFDGDELVVVEVRTRRIGKISPSETTVGPRKIATLLKSARRYVENYLCYEGNWRVDVIAVTVGADGGFRVELFSDVTAGMKGGYG